MKATPLLQQEIKVKEESKVVEESELDESDLLSIPNIWLESTIQNLDYEKDLPATLGVRKERLSLSKSNDFSGSNWLNNYKIPNVMNEIAADLRQAEISEKYETLDYHELSCLKETNEKIWEKLLQKPTSKLCPTEINL